MEKVKITTEYIKLDQFLKFCGVTDTGAEAKEIVTSGQVRVNGMVEIQRGKKLRPGDKVNVEGKVFEVE